MTNEAKYYVTIGGRTVGPVSAKQVLDGIRAGKITFDSRACRVGDEKWSPISAIDPFTGEFPQQAVKPPIEKTHVMLVSEALPALPAPPPVTLNPPASPASVPLNLPTSVPLTPSPRVGGVRTLLRVVLKPSVVAAVIVAVSLAAALSMLSTNQAPVVLPVDANRLPRTSNAIGVLPIVDAEVFTLTGSAYVSSALAGRECGGVDIASRLALARGRTLDELQADGTLDMLFDPSVRDGLRCAEALRQLLPVASVSVVEFTEDDRAMSVRMAPSATEELALGDLFQRHTFSGLAGVCRGGSDGCLPGGLAVFRDAPVWVMGSLENVEAFARSHSSPREELSVNVEILARLTTLVSEAHTTTSLVARPEHVGWTLPCRQAAPIGHEDEFVEHCFPRNQEHLLAGIEARTRGAVMAFDRVGSSSRYSFVFTLLANGATEAEGLERDLGDLARDWRSAVENNEAAIVTALRAESTYVHDDMWRAAQDPFVRALRSMTVERDDDVVTLRIQTEYTESETRQMADFLEVRRTDELALSRIVESIVSGTPPPTASLETFVGPVAAAWMTTPRATASMCAEFRARLDTLAGAGVPPLLFGLRLRLQSDFDDAWCVGQGVPTTTRDCINNAADVAALGACSFTDSPFVAAARSALTGRWVVDQTNGATASLRGAVMDIEADLLTLTTPRWVGGPTRLRISSSSTNRAIIPVPFGDQTTVMIFDLPARPTAVGALASQAIVGSWQTGLGIVETYGADGSYSYRDIRGAGHGTYSISGTRTAATLVTTLSGAAPRAWGSTTFPGPDEMRIGALVYRRVSGPRVTAWSDTSTMILVPAPPSASEAL